LRRSRRGVDRDAQVGARGLEARVDRDANIAIFTVDPPVAVDRFEVVEERARALARPEEAHAALVEREVKEAQHLLLRGRLQIDEHVATADEVHAREGRVLDHVVRGEHHHLADVGDDLVAARALQEVAREAVGRDVGDRLFAVDGAGRELDRAAMDVRGEDLHGPVAVLLGELGEQDGERVGLFAGGAARHPDAQRGITRPTLHQLGQHLVLEHLERLFVAEEARHADEQIAVENVELVAALAEAVDVLVDVVDTRQLEAPLDSPRDGARLVVREIDTELALEHVVDGFDALPARRRRRRADRPGRGALGLAVLDEHVRHLLRPEHERGDAGVPGGLRHAVELRRLRVLHDDETAGLVDVADATRTVAAAAGQHDGDGALPAVLGERAKEDVDGERQLLLPIALAEEQPAAGDDHLLLGWDQVDVVGLDQHAVLDEMDGEIGVTSEQLVHQALEVRREVLDDHEGHAAGQGHVVEERFERLEPSCRCADADDIRCRSVVRHALHRFPLL
jgi:hypothetical protein